jgi:hypothetical protein
MANPLPSVEPLETRIDSMRLREQAPNISIWEPPAHQARAAAPIAIPIEQQIVDAITQPLRAGETHRVGNDRKELQIAALLEQLTPVQSLALSTRLSNGRPDDPIVVAFERLVVERRIRLVAYLARRRSRSAR